jgi:anti-anti-sigma regulatory factor
MGQRESVRCLTGDAVGRATLELRGNVGILIVDQLLAAAREASTATQVHVDLSDAEHLDLASWQVLLSLKRTLARRGGALVIEAIPPALSRFLTIAGLDTPLGVTPGDAFAEDPS